MVASSANGTLDQPAVADNPQGVTWSPVLIAMGGAVVGGTAVWMVASDMSCSAESRGATPADRRCRGREVSRGRRRQVAASARETGCDPLPPPSSSPAMG